MRIKPVCANLGAEVFGVNANQPITQYQSKRLRDALRKHLVLLFRDQKLGVNAQISFAQVFGSLGAIADTLLGLGKRKYPEDDIPECVSVISNIKVNLSLIHI